MSENDQVTLRVGGFTPLTSIDFPGELAAVVFCQGCPWRCRYCHNPELIPSRAPERIAWSDILHFLHRRRGLLDAVVFSGGEPTAQGALAAAIDAVAALGYKIGLHTAGSYPERLAAVLPNLDWIGLDIKAPVDRYPLITGVPGSGDPAWASARLLAANGIDHEIRITVDPTLLSVATASNMIRRLRGPRTRRIVLQRLSDPGGLRGGSTVPLPDYGKYKELAARFADVSIR